LIWPAEPSYNNPIVAVEGNDWDECFNFTLLNGEKTNLDTDCELTEERFDPDKVKKVELWWRKE
jgi:hypothetical protein